MIGEMNMAVSALPPKASIRAIYGVPRNAPILTPDSAMEVARNLFSSSTLSLNALMQAGMIPVENTPLTTSQAATDAKLREIQAEHRNAGNGKHDKHRLILKKLLSKPENDTAGDRCN
mgnify:CR=1 FL=1